MRNAILAMTMVLTIAAGQIQAAVHKTPPADVGPGRIAWFDVTTTNLPQSKEFYGKLFDWQFAPVPGTDQAAEIPTGQAHWISLSPAQQVHPSQDRPCDLALQLVQ